MTAPEAATFDPDVDFASVCAGCGLPMSSELPSWRDSVNLTPDTLFLGYGATEFGESIVELDVAFDWCSLRCFARSVFSAAAAMGWRQRP